MSTLPPWIPEELNRLRREGLLRTRRSIRAFPGGWCEVDGRRLRNFAGNDYLDLAADPRVVAAAAAAVSSSSAGARASPLVCGRTPEHERLEQRLAEFERTEAALLFPTGYAANVGTIAALVRRGDLILSDRLNHASLIDGCRLSGATVRIYAHRDVEQVEHELRKHTSCERRLIVTDGVFSMDGDLAPLAELRDVARRHHAMLLVDEAHATGVYGDHGRGACELLQVEEDAIRVGTLSKALGSQGGFVAGPAALVEWLWNTARTQMFSTALAPAACAAACAALDILQHEPHRRETLHARARELRARLTERGVQIPDDACGPIVPIIVGHAQQTMDAARALEARGFLVGAIRPPTVPHGSARLRVSLCSAHRTEDVFALADAIIEILAALHA